MNKEIVIRQINIRNSVYLSLKDIKDGLLQIDAFSKEEANIWFFNTLSQTNNLESFNPQKKNDVEFAFAGELIIGTSDVFRFPISIRNSIYSHIGLNYDRKKMFLAAFEEKFISNSTLDRSEFNGEMLIKFTSIVYQFSDNLLENTKPYTC